jgi:hypothetical protein
MKLAMARTAFFQVLGVYAKGNTMLKNPEVEV